MENKLFGSLKSDLPAGLVVFLIALPLCLGVALASGAPLHAPLMSGLIAGVAGGLVVGLMSKSATSVSGPAAGLSAVVLSSILQLGAFDVFLMAVVLAGFFQLILGLLKTGFVANYIPTNVINGLLAAIGIILILKQIPHAVGFDVDNEDDFSFFQKDGENTFSELLNIFTYFSWGAILLSVLSLLILIFWNKTPMAKIKFLPVSMIVVFFGVFCNLMFKWFFPNLYISSEHLVNIPKFEGFSALLTFPSFQSIFNYKVWLVAITIAVIASLETLLNIEALENIDSKKRKSLPNNELIAQGVGNIFSGMFGGLPVTSVIVRSSVNINAGAETKLSTVFHGILLIFSLILFAPFLNQIPFASLACILLFTGYKLCSISMFKKMYSKGLNQFIPFIVTILAIVFTDLLIGVLIGSAVSILFLLKSNLDNPIKVQKGLKHAEEIYRIELHTQVSFLNKASIKEMLFGIPKNSKLVIDGSFSEFIDSDVLDEIVNFQNFIAAAKNIKLNIVGLEQKFNISNQTQFSNVLSKEEQQNMTPDAILEMLKNGNNRFVSGQSTVKYMRHQVSDLSSGQNPFALVLSCIDSRTSNEHVFDLGLGDIFSVRVAGNVLNNDILGSIEFGTHEVGVRLLVVLGHTKCGAIIGACNHVQLGNLTQLLDKIQPAIETETTIVENRNGNNIDFVNKVAKLNVLNTMRLIREQSPIVTQLEDAKALKIVGGLYDIETGVVSFFEE